MFTKNSKEIYNINKVQKRLRHHIGAAISDFNLIEKNDKIMVCMSGGKDSYVLLDMLNNLKQSAPIHFELIAVHLNQMLPGYPDGLLEEYFVKNNFDYLIVKENINKIINEKIPNQKNVCSLCSRLRRGILYKTAKEIGATKIALGHHRDDLLETFFLNLFFESKIKTMPPKLKTDDGNHIVIRPMVYCSEIDIIKYSKYKKYPIISSNLCSKHENQQRKIIKTMIKEWDKIYPGRSKIMAKALQDVSPEHLMDSSLFDFKNLSLTNKIPEEINFLSSKKSN